MKNFLASLFSAVECCAVSNFPQAIKKQLEKKAEKCSKAFKFKASNHFFSTTVSQNRRGEKAGLIALEKSRERMLQ